MDKQIKDSLRPLEQESSILKLFEEIKNPNDKKVKKLAIKLYSEVTSEVQKILCSNIYSANKPLEYATTCIAKIRDCALLVEQFIEDGCNGMIMTGKDLCTVYPVKLKTVESWLSEGKQWDPEQEDIIAHDAASAWMKEHNKGYFLGKVVLFPEFGFSGEPKIIEMKCGDVTGLVKYPGTDYYVEPNPERKI